MSGLRLAFPRDHGIGYQMLSVTGCVLSYRVTGVMGLREFIDFEIASLFLLKIYDREACQN